MRIVLLGSLLAGAALGLGSNSAAAAPRDYQPGDDSLNYLFETTGPSNGIQFARQILPATTGGSPTTDGGTIAALAQSRVIYLNKGGVTLNPGNNDSRTNVSSIASAQVAMPAWNASPQVWTDTVTCMKDMFSRFGVQVVTTDPGNVPHIEAVFTSGSMATLAPGTPNANQIGGVSPFTQDCGIIENSIVFTFTNVLPQNAQTMCEVMAQEIVHSYGADHEILPSDPMTYMQYNGKRSFQDTLSDCGEFSARPCGIGGSTCRNKQNSVALLKERVGTSNVSPPSIKSISPSAGATVPPGFTVTVNATDATAVTKVEVLLDGTLVGTKTSAPWTFATPAGTTEGVHEITVNAYDDNSNVSQVVSVTVKKGATQPTNPASGGTDGGEIQGGCSSHAPASGWLVALLLASLVIRRRQQSFAQ
jgi:hypothetical protein